MELEFGVSLANQVGFGLEVNCEVLFTRNQVDGIYRWVIKPKRWYMPSCAGDKRDGGSRWVFWLDWLGVEKDISEGYLPVMVQILWLPSTRENKSKQPLMGWKGSSKFISMLIMLFVETLFLLPPHKPPSLKWLICHTSTVLLSSGALINARLSWRFSGQGLLHSICSFMQQLELGQNDPDDNHTIITRKLVITKL